MIHNIANPRHTVSRFGQNLHLDFDQQSCAEGITMVITLNIGDIYYSHIYIECILLAACFCLLEQKCNFNYLGENNAIQLGYNGHAI